MTLTPADEPFAVSEGRMVHDVQRALRAELGSDSSQIRIYATAPDMVVLFGSVKSEQEREDAIKAAGKVSGVHRIIDRLAVGQGQVRTDLDVQSRIAQLIDDDPSFRADDIVSVVVNAGNADLGGIVDDWSQHLRATHLAFLGGATTVVNHIRVRSSPSRSEREFSYREDPYLKG